MFRGAIAVRIFQDFRQLLGEPIKLQLNYRSYEDILYLGRCVAGMVSPERVKQKGLAANCFCKR
jgi:hypothetical protein